MKEILHLCCTIVNGLLPASKLWQALVEVIMRTLELPEPSSYPTSKEYSMFVLVPLTSHLTTPVQTEADLEDDPKLCNEISTLERLEVHMHAVTATDESDGPSSNPPIADHATMEVIEESSCQGWGPFQCGRGR